MAFQKGNKHGKGRPTKADEEKANQIMINALKKLYRKDSPEEAKEELVKTLMESQRGQIFIAEHLFGKPKETVETTHNVNDFNIRDVISFKD